MPRVPVPEERPNGSVVVPPEELPDSYVETHRRRIGPHGYTANVYDGEVGVHEDIAPVLAARWREEYDAYGYHVGDDEEPDSGDESAETCQEVKDDGDVCGRELPCQYHSEEG